MQEYCLKFKKYLAMTDATLTQESSHFPQMKSVHEKVTTLTFLLGAQWLSGRVLDSRARGHGFEPHWRDCVVSLSKNINPSLVLVQPRKTHPFITER